jgi:hypothetical protein
MLRLERDVVGVVTYASEEHTVSIIRVGVKMQAVCYSEAQVPVHQTWWCHIPQDCNLVTEDMQSEFHISRQRFLMALLCLYSEML